MEFRLKPIKLFSPKYPLYYDYVPVLGHLDHNTYHEMSYLDKLSVVKYVIGMITWEERTEFSQIRHIMKWCGEQDINYYISYGYMDENVHIIDILMFFYNKSDAAKFKMFWYKKIDHCMNSNINAIEYCKKWYEDDYQL
jgi:hypothetical protein